MRERASCRLVIRTDGHDHDQQLIILAGGDSDLRAGSDVERTDIKRAAGAVRRNIVDIIEDDTSDKIAELFDGDFGSENARRGKIESARIFIRTEDFDRTVLSAERLESLESSLPVVETCRGDGHGDGVFIHQDAGVPLAVFIRAADMRSDRHVTEAEGSPVDVGSDVV